MCSREKGMLSTNESIRNAPVAKCKDKSKNCSPATVMTSSGAIGFLVKYNGGGRRMVRLCHNKPYENGNTSTMATHA